MLLFVFTTEKTNANKNEYDDFVCMFKRQKNTLLSLTKKTIEEKSLAGVD